jgi:hypothetical protein
VRRGQRIAPGLLRVPMGRTPGEGSSSGQPLTLTTKGGGQGDAVGLMIPRSRAPWGCLFFSILGLSVIIAVFSMKWAVITGAAALIAYWAAFNHPQRSATDAVQRTYQLLGAGKAERASQALEPLLSDDFPEEGLNYLAALVELTRRRPAQALAYLEEARSQMQIYAEFHHMLGRCLRDLSRREEAERAYEEALSFPDYPHRELVMQERDSLGGETP